ncbi:MAG: hypothetical protein HQL83_17120 [Magnetococcales bacterium]|nr:hypothetical protein [Magnetococcales bacterium]
MIINKLLKEKRGLGDCPQGFDFDFEFKQKGFHAPAFDFVFEVKTLGAIPKAPFFS